MRQGNHSSAKWALAVATLVVLVSGSIVMGSNMGFKFNMALVPAGLLGPPQGDNVMSLPYLVPYANRQCLCDQLGLNPGATVVQQFDALTGGFSFYLCGAGGSTCAAPTGNFQLDTKNAVWITDNGVPASVIVVGAHDPSANIQLACKPAATPLPAGDNWVSVPYHTTSVTKQDLCDEIGSVNAIFTNDAATGAFPFYQCGNLPSDGPLPPKGESVIVVLDTASAACTGPGVVNWVPNHF